MSTLWSAEQREWLQAMGHQVWMLADASGRDAEPVVADDVGRRPPMADAPARGMASRETASRESTSREPARPRAGAGNDRLLQALRRAAAGADETALAALLPDSGTLRGNAAAKRALWPRLRALRRSGRA